MGYSSDVTDKEWEIIEPLLPQKKRLKIRLLSVLLAFNAIPYILKIKRASFFAIMALLRSDITNTK